MISLTAQGICNAVNGRLVGGPTDRVASGGICTDSRCPVPEGVFFALSGERFDGNSFAPAVSARVAAVVVSRVEPGIDDSCAVILVDDVLTALQKLAKWWRAALPVCAIGLTGSNGKTSTKDLCACLLSQAFPTVATEGNLNNHIGVPLSILKASLTDRVAVWEMGMNHRGELAPLCEMVQPSIGIITSIGSSHMEFLGSRDNIAEEKCTVARVLPADGFMIYPASCDYAEKIRLSTKATCVDCGIDCGTVRAENLRQTPQGSSFTLVIPEFCRMEVHLPVHGRHMVENALLASAAAWKVGVSPELISKGLDSVNLTNGRLHCLDIGGICVIDDTYNANPDSMQAALRTMGSLPCSGKRYAVLGHMGELGDFSDAGHALVGRAAAETGVDVLISVGPAARRMTEGLGDVSTMQTVHVEAGQEAADWLRPRLAPGDCILFKGSRSARMEQVLKLVFPER